MKFSWTSIKISITDARLSHLVQQDKIWDHGSIVEHVRTVVVLLKKAFLRRDAQLMKKCMTDTAYQKMKIEIKQRGDVSIYKSIIDKGLENISIINVVKGKDRQADRFTASLKFKLNPNAEDWVFVRQGDWWVLQQLKQSHHLLKYFL